MGLWRRRRGPDVLTERVNAVRAQVEELLDGIHAKIGADYGGDRAGVVARRVRVARPGQPSAVG